MNYLDNAATTLVKPRAVGEAVHRALTGAAGYARGGYAAAQRAGDLVYDCREQAAALFGLYDPSRVVFTQNATHALNIAIHALARPGMKVAVSGFEHNAVMRPLALHGIARPCCTRRSGSRSAWCRRSEGRSGKGRSCSS